MLNNLLNERHSKRKRFVILFISIFCCIIFCSCQSSPNVIMKVDMLSDAYSTGDLSVINEDYQDALERCQKRLDEVPEDSLAAADAYKTMGGIYAGYLEDADNAAYYINKAIQIDENNDFKLGLAQDYNHMSKIYICIGGDRSGRAISKGTENL